MSSVTEIVARGMTGWASSVRSTDSASSTACDGLDCPEGRPVPGRHALHSIVGHHGHSGVADLHRRHRGNLLQVGLKGGHVGQHQRLDGLVHPAPCPVRDFAQ